MDGKKYRQSTQILRKTKGHSILLEGVWIGSTDSGNLLSPCDLEL